MADKVSDVNIEIGVQLSVVVEFCVENIIAVCLTHKGRDFRGILLECNAGLYPGGLPCSRYLSALKYADLKDATTQLHKNGPLSSHNQSENGHSAISIEGHQSGVPACVQRFSYNNDPFLTHPRLSPELTVVEMKPVGPRKKTIRDIRLRPRQTLCSNCKSAIHEVKKNRNATPPRQSDNLRDSSDRRLRTRTRERSSSSSNSLQPVLGKRKCPSSSPMVLLEDITRKSGKLNTVKNMKIGTDDKSTQGQKQNTEKNIYCATIDTLNCMTNKANFNGKIQPEDNDTLDLHSQPGAIDSEACTDALLPRGRKNKLITSDFITKPTPAIKISIGDGDILKIPPRLPETEILSPNETSIALKSKNSDTKESQTPHKKAKKSGRKSRDKERHRAIEEVNGHSDIVSNDNTVSKPQKRHKKKHRHRHESLDTNTNTSVTENEYKPIEPEMKEKPTQPSQPLPTKIKVGDVFIDVVDISESESDKEICNGNSAKDENHENTSPAFNDVANNRPRLVYTWKQDEGLSRVATTPQRLSPEHSSHYMVKTSPSIVPMSNSPHRRKNASPCRVVSASPNIHYTNSPSCLLKDYPLRSKTSCSLPGQPPDLLSMAEQHNVIHTSEDSQSHSSGLDSHLSDISDDSGEEQQSDDIFSNATNIGNDQEDKGSIKPLMMKIQTQNVNGCLLEEGREIHVGDIVWGKIQGFPWWPGRVSGITVTQRDNDVVITQLANVAWFGSNTMSHVRCCDLFPFLEDFKVRYNKKKKGQYRLAIKQATLAARRLHADSRTDLIDFGD